ncbi:MULTISPECIES: Flp pilus assembly protein CpaB [Acidiphilium]|uniref:Pilus assembly protein CpaB n=1 Tax=Acidiphilium rubrum TaxID=526 RepID=A0A8G2CLF4_ACIRU|nr:MULTISPECIES: Flp pilus assembly protein CpaB [Acidiphilium]SIQ71885.1 pilus assembly protein CpaB [Acidiphilium rubrum]
MNLRLVAAGVLIVAALGLGLIAEQSFHAAAAAKRSASAQLMTDIIVAAHPLPAGTLAREADFTGELILKTRRPAGAIPYTEAAVASLNGALVRHYVESGGLVTRADILRPRDRGFLAAVLRPGTRAISVPVNVVSGVSGLIWPGDHVDILLTETMPTATTPRADQVFSELVLRDIRVIAIGQNIVQGAAGNPQATAAASATLYQTVTLQVSPRAAQKIVVAQQLGSLSLIVRSAHTPTGDTADTGPATAVYASTVSPALARSSHPVGQRINVIEGSNRREVVLP